MLPISQKGILLGLLLALIAALSTLGIFKLYQKKQTRENPVANPSEAVQTLAPNAGSNKSPN